MTSGFLSLTSPPSNSAFNPTASTSLGSLFTASLQTFSPRYFPPSFGPFNTHNSLSPTGTHTLHLLRSSLLAKPNASLPSPKDHPSPPLSPRSSKPSTPSNPPLFNPCSPKTPSPSGQNKSPLPSLTSRCALPSCTTRSNTNSALPSQNNTTNISCVCVHPNSGLLLRPPAISLTLLGVPCKPPPTALPSRLLLSQLLPPKNPCAKQRFCAPILRISGFICIEQRGQGGLSCAPTLRVSGPCLRPFTPHNTR